MATKFWVPIAISAIANNGSGASRCTVSSTTNLSTTAFLFGVTGTTGLNGQQTITIIDATHFDVVAVSFVATGTGSVNGLWSSTNTANWSTSTGGAGGAAVPTTGDAITFDGNSGSGTVSVDATVSGLSLASITMGAFTGTLDFSFGNPSLTITGIFSVTGTATRTLNLGSGTFTFTLVNGVVWDATTITGLTFDAGTSTLATSGTITASRILTLNTLTYSTISIGSPGNANLQNLNGSATVGTLNITAPANVSFTNGETLTITSAFNWAGSSSNQLGLLSSSAIAVSTISVASGLPTISWAALKYLAFTGGATFAANNSFDLKGNTGITITPPSAGGGGGVFGS